MIMPQQRSSWWLNLEPKGAGITAGRCGEVPLCAFGAASIIVLEAPIGKVIAIHNHIHKASSAWTSVHFQLAGHSSPSGDIML